MTHYEYQQRLLFMRLLRAPGDLEKEALDGLIEDRLRLQEAKRLGIKPAEEDLRKGMEEFAARANLSADDFIKALIDRYMTDPAQRVQFDGSEWQGLGRSRWRKSVDYICCLN